MTPELLVLPRTGCRIFLQLLQIWAIVEHSEIVTILFYKNNIYYGMNYALIPQDI